jgi:ribosomal protein L11 methyltransferase
MNRRDESGGRPTWWEVHASISTPDVAVAEFVAALLRDAAPAGLAEAADGWLAFVPDERAAHELAARLLTVAGTPCQVRPVNDDEWSAWRFAFQPIVISGRLIVVPVYDPAEQPAPAPGIDADACPGCAAIYIEPGLAFGTGEHPTTANCLRYLVGHVRPGARVLDVGTGSGILAIAAVALGAAHCVGIDIDPVAIRSAKANLLLNPSVQGRVDLVCGDATTIDLTEQPRTPPGADSVGGGFDVVVANLTTSLIAVLLPVLRSYVAPGGHLILSGISAERAAELSEPMAAAGLATLHTTNEQGWLTMLCQPVALP